MLADLETAAAALYVRNDDLLNDNPHRMAARAAHFALGARSPDTEEVTAMPEQPVKPRADLARYQPASRSTSWAGSPPPTNKHAPPKPHWPPPSPEPAKPERPGRSSEPNSASYAKAHNNASRAHRLMSQRSRQHTRNDTNRRTRQPPILRSRNRTRATPGELRDRHPWGIT